MSSDFSLMVHGGAGQFSDVKSRADEQEYLQHVDAILTLGRSVLHKGGSALQAVEICVCALEDDALFNAGRGAVLNADGNVEMDAAIMDGRDLSAGAVAAVTGVKNPVSAAERIRQKGRHVMLAGDGALKFAIEQGLEQQDPGYFIIDKRLEQFKQLQGSERSALDHDVDAVVDEGHDTVGAVARDSHGNLAAATSTGGLINKLAGRVGDSPIVGAGVYADNNTCAISATGYGEQIMRVMLAKHIADRMALCGDTLALAVDRGMQYFAERVHGQGGVIAIDKDGHCCSRYSTQHMVHGWIETGSECVCRF